MDNLVLILVSHSIMAALVAAVGVFTSEPTPVRSMTLSRQVISNPRALQGFLYSRPSISLAVALLSEVEFIFIRFLKLGVIIPLIKYINTIKIKP